MKCRIVATFLLLAAAFLLLGCVETEKKEEENKIKVFSNGLSAEIYRVSREYVYPGEPLLINVRIFNNGDRNAKLENITLLGSVLSVDGDISKSVNKVIAPKSIYIESFDLKVLDIPGINVLRFWPAVCYEYNSSGYFYIYVTSDASVYDSLKNKYVTIENVQERGPLSLVVKGEPVVYLINSSDGYSRSVSLEIYVTSESINGWPVISCNEIANATIESIEFSINCSEDISCYFILSDNSDQKESKENEMKLSISSFMPDIPSIPPPHPPPPPPHPPPSPPPPPPPYPPPPEQNVPPSTYKERIVYNIVYKNIPFRVSAGRTTRSYILKIGVSSKDYVQMGQIIIKYNISYHYYRIFPESKIEIRVKG